MASVKISSFIICKNEERVIENALRSLSWSDEIVVIDGYSSDKTPEIVRKYTNKLFQRQWTNFGEQRNFALTKVEHPWVFFLDADEECSSELVQWFKKFKEFGIEGVRSDLLESNSEYLDPQGKQSSRVDLIEIRRLEHFKGRLYRFGANNPSYQWRLFRKEQATFVGAIHEAVKVPGLIKRLEKPILHFPRTDLYGMMVKMNRYTSLEADQLYASGKRKPLNYMFFSGLAMFLKGYFRKRGYRDGILGFILAVMDGSSFFLRQAKLYLLNNQGRH